MHQVHNPANAGVSTEFRTIGVDMAIERSSSGAGSVDPNVQRTKNYLAETITELKKTTWPTKKEATKLTQVVVGVIVVLGFYMGILDAILSYVINKIGPVKH